MIIAIIDGYYEGQISEIEEPIEVTIPIPNGLPKINSGYERIWKVIRHHNGVTDVLDAKLTENGISFMNDKYSEFALVYEDVKIEQPEDTKIEPIEDTKQEELKPEKSESEEVKPEIADNPSKENTNDSDTNNPETGDSIILWISLALISTVSIIETKNIFRKEKNK